MSVDANASPCKARIFNTCFRLMEFKTALCNADLVVNAARIVEEAAERFDLSG